MTNSEPSLFARILSTVITVILVLFVILVPLSLIVLCVRFLLSTFGLI